MKTNDVIGELHDKLTPQAEVIDVPSRPLAVVAPPPVPTLFSQMPPAQKLEYAREVASVLKGMLREGKIVIDANGKEKREPLIVRVPLKYDGQIVGYSEHVRVEGWLTCGMLAGNCTAPVRSTEDVEGGYKALAEVVCQGQVIGSAIARCDRSESKWKNKPNFQLESMAETRAQSKALASVFRWIMTLAGFSSTPAEEMDSTITVDEPQEKPAAPKPVRRPRAAKPQPAPEPEPEKMDPERQRVVRRIFALADDFERIAGERGASFKARLHDADERHALVASLFKGKSRLRELDSTQLLQFVAKIEQRIAEHTA